MPTDPRCPVTSAAGREDALRDDRRPTVRLTTAQALVRWMIAQRSELLDGTEVPLFAGRLRDLRPRQRARARHRAARGRATSCRPGAARTSRAWRWPRSAYARATDRRQVMAATTLDRPGRAQHGHRCRASPTPTGCRCCCCPATRSPAGRRTRCSSRSSTSATRRPRSTTPSARSRATSTGSPGPSSCSRRCRRWPGCSPTPPTAGPVVLALPQDVQVEEFDFPRGDVRAAGAPRAAAARRPRRRSPRAAEHPARRAAAAARPRRRRALLRGRRRGARVRRGARRTRSSRPSPAARWCRTTTRCTAARSASSAPTSANDARRRGRRRARGRHPAAGLHHLVVDRLRRRRADRHRQRRPLRRGQARRPGGGRRRPRDAGRARRRRWATGWRRPAWADRARAAKAATGTPHVDRLRAGGVAPDGVAHLRPGGRRRQRRERPGRLRAHRVRRHAGRAARRLAHRQRHARRAATSGATMDLEYGFSCMGYEVVAPWGAAMARARPTPTALVTVDLRRRLLPDAQLRALLRGVRRAPRTSRCSATTRGFAVIHRLQTSQGADGFNNLLADSRGPGADGRRCTSTSPRTPASLGLPRRGRAPTATSTSCGRRTPRARARPSPSSGPRSWSAGSHHVHLDRGRRLVGDRRARVAVRPRGVRRGQGAPGPLGVSPAALTSVSA